jgi:hypothetical protein
VEPFFVLRKVPQEGAHMRRFLSIASVTVALFVCSSVLAGIDTSYSTDKVGFSQSTSVGLMTTNLFVSVQRHDGVIDGSNVGVYPDSLNNKVLHVSEYIYGRVGFSPTMTSKLNQSFYINSLNAYFSEFASTSFYDVNEVGKGDVTLTGTSTTSGVTGPDYWSTGSASFNGNNFTVMSSNGNYNEYVNTWNGVSTTYFSGEGSWILQFPNAKATEVYIHNASVPEPASLGLLTLSSLGLLARRRRM